MTPEEQRRQLAQQALGAWTGAPMSGVGAEPVDPIAAQDAALAAQANTDASYRNGGDELVDPASVSSMPSPEPMSSEPPPMSTQQQLAAEAYRTWMPAPASVPSAPPAPESNVIEMPPQDIVGMPAPSAQSGGGQGRPSLLTEQSAMAAASRDQADQARAEADDSVDKQADLTEQKGQQRAEEAKQQLALAQQQQADLEEAGRVANERRAVKEAVFTDLSNQHKRLNDEAAAIQIRDRRSTGQRVLGAIAIALGGMQDQNNLVAGLKQGLNVQTHNADQAMAMINESIERDLAIQRANLDNKRNSAAAKYSELGIARDTIKDVDAQETMAKAALMDKYALGLDAIKAQGMGETATTTAQLAAEQLRGNARAMRAQTLEQTAAKDEDRQWALQVQREQERKAAARGPKQMSPKELADLEGKLLDNASKRRELEGGAQGVYGLRPIAGKPDEGATKEAQKILSGTEGVRETINQLRQMAKNGATLSPTERATARRRLGSLKSQFNGVFGDGTAPNEAQLKDLDNYFVNPTEVNMADAEQVFATFDEDAKAMAKAKVRGFGYALDMPDVRAE